MRGGNWRFVVFDCTEGTEQVPRVKIVTRAVAAAKYAATGGVPVAGHLYGSKFDHSVVGEVAGVFPDFKQALHVALEAGQRLQARLDARLQQELAEAEDDEERRQVRDYYEWFRQPHLEAEFTPGEPAVESAVSVVKLAQDREALTAFLDELHPAWGE